MTQYIYALCDPDSQIPFYIGKTKNIEKRYRSHLTIELKNKTKKSFWIKKLLKENKKPTISILDTADSSNIDEKEIYYITLWKSKNPKLKNMTDGGTGGTTHYGKPVKIQCSNGKTYNSIKEASEELKVHRTAINAIIKGKSISAKGYRFCLLGKSIENREKKKTVKPINCSNGKRYSSITEAAKDLKIEAKNISSCAKGKRNNVGGFDFWYDGDVKKRKTVGKPIVCTNNGKIYPNARIAAIDLGLSYKTISNYLTGHRKTAKGYCFVFYKKVE